MDFLCTTVFVFSFSLFLVIDVVQWLFVSFRAHVKYLRIASYRSLDNNMARWHPHHFAATVSFIAGLTDDRSRVLRNKRLTVT